MNPFTHIDDSGNAVMVDVGEKQKTMRQAIAVGRIRMSAECYDAVRQNAVKKGDVLGVARVAGIMATKQTSQLIPLCHALQLERSAIDFSWFDEQREIEAVCTVKTTGVTGVEMEALTGVTVALLTIYDMCKAIDKGMELTGVQLREKTGGKSGNYRRAEP